MEVIDIKLHEFLVDFDFSLRNNLLKGTFIGKAALIIGEVSVIYGVKLSEFMLSIDDILSVELGQVLKVIRSDFIQIIGHVFMSWDSVEHGQDLVHMLPVLHVKNVASI